MIIVDKIITISLKEKIDRQESAKRELAKLGIETTFYLADRDCGHEERGCFSSHREVARQALADESCQSLLVFEDDVKIRSLISTSAIEQINYFIQHKQEHFDIFYLGLIIGKMWFCGMKSIVRAKGAGAHAYILSRRGMKKLAASQWTGVPIDKIMKREFKGYSLYPIVAEQFPEGVMPSDLMGSRSTKEIKTEKFWEDNYRKQRFILWKNVHKSFVVWMGGK